MRVNYIYKKENIIKNFNSIDSRIELKEYQDSLVLYSPMNSNFRAEYAYYDKVAQYIEKPEIFTGGPFGSYLKISNDYSFDIGNFKSVDKIGRISFYLSSNKIIESSKQGLVEKPDFPEEGLPAGDYSFTVTVDGRPTSTMVLNLPKGATTKLIKNKILFSLDPYVYPFELNVANTEEKKIVIQSSVEGKTLNITNGLEGNNLLDYYDVEPIEYGSSPAEEITFFKLFNLSISHYKNIEKGSDESYLRFKTENEDKEQIFDVKWNTNSIDFDNIEIDFDDNVGYIFINGKLVNIQIMDVKFEKNNNTLTLSGTKENPYSFDELILNERCIHTKDFELPKTQLTRYSTEKPYIDFYFAGSEVKKGMALKTLSYNNIECCICDDGKFYYYSNGSFRRGTGSYGDSNEWATFSEKIKEFDYSGKDVFIRCFFVSDGTVLSYLDTPYFEMSDDYYEDKNGNTAAILIGTKEWQEGDVEDLDGKKLVITTDQGTTNIDFENPESSGEGSEEFEWTAQNVADYINSYYPDGIANCYVDSKGRVVLVSETKGKDAFITVNGNAAGPIFGEDAEKTANGSDADAGTIDYTDFYDAVRTYTGSPLITMEITDDMMRLYLKEALAYYKKWRANNVNQYTCQLKGNWKEGYEIPSIVESQNDIIDLIFKPIFPITFYGSDFISNGSENIFTLTLAQSLFAGRGGMKNAQGITQDFYVSLMGMQDFKQALGLNPTFEIMNGRLYIYPSSVARFTNVAIKYKAPLSEEECLKDPDIIKYVHGKCLMTMGNIRGQYGGALQSGSLALQFNADALYERGKTLVDAVIEEWKKQQPPLGFFFG